MVAHTMKGNRLDQNRGAKPYGKMLIVAFGLAMLGVIVVHKLREKRIINLIVEEKDQQLLSLQLLLQRELDLNKAMSKKVEDLKPRLHMLRVQKMELNGRVAELQSTIASLKDEIKTIELALKEKDSENRMLRDKVTEILKEKEAKVDEVKPEGGTEKTVKVWSVSSDDPSKVNDSVGNTDDLRKAGDSRFYKSMGNNIRTREDGMLKSENVDGGVEVLEVQEQDTPTTVVKRDDGEMATENGKGGEHEEVSRAEMKPEEKPDKSQASGGSRRNELHQAPGRTKGKKWRAIVKSRGLEHDVAMRRRTRHGEMAVARENELLVKNEQTEVHGIRLSRKNDLGVMEKKIDRDEKSQAADSLVLSVEDKEKGEEKKPDVITIEGRLETNEVAWNSTADSEHMIFREHGTDSNGFTKNDDVANETEVSDVHHDLKGSTGNSNFLEKYVTKDVPRLLSNNEAENGHSDPTSFKENEDDSRKSEVGNGHSTSGEENENVTHGSETKHNQHDPISHSEVEDDDNLQDSEFESSRSDTEEETGATEDSHDSLISHTGEDDASHETSDAEAEKEDYKE